MSLLESALLLAQMPRDWVEVCGAAIFMVMVACSAGFGSSRSLLIGDLALTGLLQFALPLILNSPLDPAHLRGEPLLQWSAALATGLAMLGILLNHRARMKQPAK